MAILSGQSTNLVFCLFSILLVKNTHINILNIKTNNFSKHITFIAMNIAIIARETANLIAEIVYFGHKKMDTLKKLFVLIFRMFICM